MKGIVLAVHVGPIRPLGPEGVPSGFVKNPISGDVTLSDLGLAGDAQADLIFHGGLDKAVYAYAESHYEAWRRDFPNHRALLVPGSLGENLTITKFDEASVCIGDIFSIGSTVLQVSQPRQPCFKLGLAFDDPLMPRAMIQNYRSGWYFRVLQTGHLRAGSEVSLLDRPLPAWPILRLNRLGAVRSANPLEIDELARMSLLGDGWRGSIAGLRQATETFRQSKSL